MDISAVIITHNEAHNISRCLEAAARVADELIVVDAESTDGTVAIAGSSGARVTVRAWTNYSDQKNFANDLARGPYILSLDADEVLGDELTADILRQKATGLHGAYRLKRLTNYCGQWVRHGGWYPDAKVRLFPKQGVRWEGDHVHEILALPSGTAITDLKGDLLYLAHNGGDELVVIDISDGSAPVVVSTLSITEALAVELVGDIALVIPRTTDDLYLVDISEPSSPSILLIHHLLGGTYSVVHQAGYAYVGCAAVGVNVVRLSCPSHVLLDPASGAG